MMIEFFKSIPFEIEEAAILDGASPFGIFKDIYLPFGCPCPGKSLSGRFHCQLG
jgi:ABC-type glycerol-3-phosphate transport system permease component